MSTSRKNLSGRLILSLIAVFTIVAPFLADWNESHIYNPLWPPHARFHNAQTMSMAVFLGVSALYLLWSKLRQQRSARLAAILFSALYWITQAASFLYPGVAWTDPDLLKPGQSLSQFPPQLMLDIVLFLLIGAAGWLLKTTEANRREMVAP